MDQIKILFVEDFEEDIRTFEDTIKRFNSESKRTIKYVKCNSFEPEFDTCKDIFSN